MCVGVRICDLYIWVWCYTSCHVSQFSSDIPIKAVTTLAGCFTATIQGQQIPQALGNQGIATVHTISYWQKYGFVATLFHQSYSWKESI